jgi:hypothetical protein
MHSSAMTRDLCPTFNRFFPYMKNMLSIKLKATKRISIFGALAI